jgi:hypothetical protein
MNRIQAQAPKELNQFRHDRLSVALAIGLPLLTLLMALGMADGGDDFGD